MWDSSIIFYWLSFILESRDTIGKFASMVGCVRVKWQLRLSFALLALGILILTVLWICNFASLPKRSSSTAILIDLTLSHFHTFPQSASTIPSPSWILDYKFLSPTLSAVSPCENPILLWFSNHRKSWGFYWATPRLLWSKGEAQGTWFKNPHQWQL